MSGVDQPFKEARAVFEGQGGMLRMAEAIERGISRYTLYAMRDAGIIERMSRGLYRLTDLEPLGNPDLVTCARRIPHGIICLTSALAYYELTTQVPHVVDVAIRMDREAPRVDYPPVRLWWLSKKTFDAGIVEHSIDGAKVKMYTAEKSITDAFKFRGKIGSDVAVEALRNWYIKPGRDLGALQRYAKICRVTNVLRPYLEALQ
ncbi:MAG: type IV toxin-antitoxin system AbiEi family antitoxin domain-containing protein [Myxococcales bacterium]|nr:MAG: type IV toxin-antitoxin system AbiEi family antitoxin domain-containing protein [Myxococcales bacterium]